MRKKLLWQFSLFLLFNLSQFQHANAQGEIDTTFNGGTLNIRWNSIYDVEYNVSNPRDSLAYNYTITVQGEWEGDNETNAFTTEHTANATSDNYQNIVDSLSNVVKNELNDLNDLSIFCETTNRVFDELIDSECYNYAYLGSTYGSNTTREIEEQSDDIQYIGEIDDIDSLVVFNGSMGLVIEQTITETQDWKEHINTIYENCTYHVLITLEHDDNNNGIGDSCED